MISPEQIKKLCDAYDIGEPGSFDEIGEGTLNRNYLLTTGKGKYFIKSVREKMKDKLATVFAIETYMKSNGIPAIAMLATLAGEIFQVYGDEVVTVYPFVESDRSHIYDAGDFRRMGTLLAKIHKVGKGELPESLKELRRFKRPEDEAILERLRGYEAEILSREKRDEIDGLFLRYIGFKLETAPKLETLELPNDTFIHGDYHLGNLLIDKESREIIGVCDWEKAEYAPRAYELARSLFYTCFEGQRDVERSLEYAKAYYDGYLGIFPMPKGEIMRGIAMRVHRTVLSSWIEETYYKRGDDRANKFIEHEMHLVDLAVNKGLLERIESLLA